MVLSHLSNVEKIKINRFNWYYDTFTADRVDVKKVMSGNTQPRVTYNRNDLITFTMAFGMWENKCTVIVLRIVTEEIGMKINKIIGRYDFFFFFNLPRLA